MFRAAAALSVVCLLTAVQDPAPGPATLRTAQQLAVPTAEHARLQRLVGEWNVAVQPAAGREERGRMHAAAILGGRHVVLNFAFELQGAKVEAVQILGFDTLRQVYTSSWRDDLSTWSVEAAGAARPDNPEQLRLPGTVCDARDPTGRPFRLEFDLPAVAAAREVVVRLYDTVDGKDVLMQTQRWSPR